ncbi:MAG: hypothetical protein MHPSP_002094, partial [Paramarteilia canceri]
MHCDSLHKTEYICHHNEVCRCLALHFFAQYGLMSSKRLRIFRMNEIAENQREVIYYDVHILTAAIIAENGPDILIIDKVHRKGLIFILGITTAADFKLCVDDKG